MASLEVQSWPRARSLLWAAARLGAFAHERGIDPSSDDVLGVGFVERFLAEGTPTWSAPARRTARSNLYFLAHQSARSGPRQARLSRERAQAPYSEAELAAYLALADAQPTVARRQRASGLIALGCGGGADRGGPAPCPWHRRRGALWRGARRRQRRQGARRCRSEPSWPARALGAGAWAKDGFIVGGAEPTRRNVTSPLIASLAEGPDLPRLIFGPTALDVGDPVCGRHRPGHLHGRGRHACSQRLGDVVAHLDPGDEARAVALLGGTVSDG